MIYFYDFGFNLLLAEPQVISWKLSKKYNGVGTFSAELPLTSPATELVMENDFLIAKAGGEYVVVTGCEISDKLTIYARTPNWLFTKRVVLPREEITAESGMFLRTLLYEMYGDSDDLLVGKIKVCGEKTFTFDKPELLSKIVFDTLSDEGLGNELTCSARNKKWIFNMLIGEERDIMVSESNKNAVSGSIISNISEKAHFCYFEDGQGGYTGKGENSVGFYRFETFVSSEDEPDADKKLQESEKENSVSLEAVGLKYKRDYNLGDSVRVQITKGGYRVTKRLRITGVEMSYGIDGYREKPVFEQ